MAGYHIPGVGHSDRVGVALAARPGLSAVVGLHRNCFRKDTDIPDTNICRRLYVSLLGQCRLFQEGNSKE